MATTGCRAMATASTAATARRHRQVPDGQAVQAAAGSSPQGRARRRTLRTSAPVPPLRARGGPAAAAPLSSGRCRTARGATGPQTQTARAQPPRPRRRRSPPTPVAAPAAAATAEARGLAHSRGTRLRRAPPAAMDASHRRQCGRGRAAAAEAEAASAVPARTLQLSSCSRPMAAALQARRHCHRRRRLRAMPPRLLPDPSLALRIMHSVRLTYPRSALTQPARLRSRFHLDLQLLMNPK